MGKKKGKAQNGRAKQKQKAGGTPRSAPRAGNSWQQQMLDDDWEEDSPVRFRGFAQNTPSRSATQATPAKLRHQAIAFVSAGVNESTIKLRPQPEDTSDGDITFDDSDDDDGDNLNDQDIDDNAIQTNILLDAEIERSEQGVARLNIHSTAERMDLDTRTESTTTSDVNIIGVDRDGARAAAGSPEALPFVVDTVGDVSLSNTNSRRAAKRAPSPAPSDSSAEVVVFLGRNSKPTVVNDPVTQAPGQKLPTTQPLQRTGAPQNPPRSMGWGSQPSKFAAPVNNGWAPAPTVPYWKSGKGMPRPDLAPSAAEKAFEEAVPRQSRVQFVEPAPSVNAASTVDTMTTASDRTQAMTDKKSAKQKEVDFERLDTKAPTSSRRTKRGRKKDNRAMRKAINSDDDDHHNEAAYDDFIQNLKAQADAEDEDTFLESLKTPRHSMSIAGPSLVVDGSEIGDNEVLARHTREDADIIYGPDDDDSDWESDDSELKPDMDELSSNDLNASDLEDDSDLEEELEYSERQQWEDEEDLRQRRRDRMTDETIARLLAKQEELGIEGDELMLEDGMYMSVSDDGFGDVDAARSSLADISNSSFGRGNKHGMRRRGGGGPRFADASALADTVEQYGENGFDIMDFDRPSLRPTKKGRKGKLPPEVEMLSDEELKEELRGQWENDRGKKRQQKLEREERRQQGLLGAAGRSGKADLKAKYPQGMSMVDIHRELRDFLQDENVRERAFPPMLKKDRKALHEICIALNVNSRSQGTGKNRFPVIYKTSRTEEYSSETFSRIIQKSNRGFLANSSRKGKAGGKAANGPGGFGRGRGGGTAAATYQHGETVGAQAPEIGQNNFGHKLMLKMGWTAERGLGKDGEGRLVPVEQIMRRGTAGLG